MLEGDGEVLKDNGEVLKGAGDTLKEDREAFICNKRVLKGDTYA